MPAQSRRMRTIAIFAISVHSFIGTQPIEEIAMIDLKREKLLSLRDASRAVPKIDGRKPHMSTLWRWCRKGVRGVRLEYVRLGHRVCTSSEALSRFANNLADVDARDYATAPPTKKSKPKLTRTDRQRVEAVAEANARLEREGI